MKRTARTLGALLAAAMLLSSQALEADTVPGSQTRQPAIVINEVESDAPNKGNNWVEITNIGSEAVELSGWYLTDDKGEERKTEGKTTPLPEGTILEPGAFLLFEETVNFDFGLGKADTAILYDAGGEKIDSYAYTGVAVGTWSRQSDGSFADADATKPTEKPMNAPKTGDDSTLWVWATLAVLSAGACFAVIFILPRQKKKC